MSDRGQRTEKPTQRRIDKSRREGRFASSREFVAGVQFLLVVWAAGAWGPEAWQQFAIWFRGSLAAAVDRGELSIGSWARLMRDSLPIFLPLTAMGAALAATGLAAQFSVTGLGWSAKNLSPDLTRLNLGRRLREIFRQNSSQTLQSIALLPLLGILVWVFIGERIDSLLALSRVGLPSAIGAFGSTAKNLLWDVALVLLAWGVADLIRQKKRHLRDLRMTKQEVRDEGKETDGNPQVKGRIRRLQRDWLRRRMMPTATAVVVNPTHFAVAIRYLPDSMTAPVVVAKGKNRRARRIRQRAVAGSVPIVENPPLAQALYQSSDVGSEIPESLYRAVAEVQAYVFHLSRRRAAPPAGPPGGRR